jgi:predicted TIM-barrel fold metal-dependent hydrolase
MCIGKMMMSGSFLRFPNVKFIFAHYGGVLPFIKERFDNTYLMLRKREFVKDLGKIPSQFFENLYFDISGANSPAALLGALELTDSSHIIFGSDYPANQNIGITINMVNSLGISSIDKKNILRNLLIFA